MTVKKKCTALDGPYIMPGWGCCKCHVYNGNQRRECRNCGHIRCVNKNMIEASEIYHRLWQGSKPPKGVSVARAGFNVLVLAAVEHQLPPSAYPGVVVFHAPLDDDELTPEEWTLAKKVALGVARALRAGKRVLVTCQQGRNRSGLVSAMALHMLTGESGSNIVRHIKMRRAGALTNVSFVKALAKLPERR